MHFKANFSNIIFPNLIQYLWKGLKKFVVRKKMPRTLLHSVRKNALFVGFVVIQAGKPQNYAISHKRAE